MLQEEQYSLQLDQGWHDQGVLARGTSVLTDAWIYDKEGGCLFQGSFFFRTVKDERVIVSARGVCENFRNLFSAVKVNLFFLW